MHRLVLVILAVVLSCGIAAAQDRLSYVCPTIFIEGPDRLLKPGETASLTATVKQVGPELPIKYNWHVTYGKIVSGQGTATIEVEKTPSSTLTATIEIDGTPKENHCLQTASRIVTWDAPAECPTISVTGPAGIPRPGDKVPFRVDVGEKGKDYDLKYRWTTSTGEIVSGQSTTSIEVKFEGGMNLTVTVEVIGLPKDCGAMVSESIPWESPIEAVRVGLIHAHETGIFEKKLKEFSDELVSNPNNQGYIFIGSRPDSKDSDLAAREKKLIDNLAKLMGSSYDRSRLTLVRWGGKSDLIELWRIPPGADNPTCKECDTQLQCPSISVTGPAGVVQPGDVATFSANVDDQQRLGPLQYRWTFTGGELLKGQDMAVITVRAKKTMPVQMYATVQVSSLPQGCPDTATEKVQFFGEPHPLLLDEFGRMANDAIETRLRKLYVELSNNPNSQGYVIVYGTEKEMTARERLIVKSVSFRNFDRSRITIVRGGRHQSGKVYTKLYRIPPGVEYPAP